VTIESTQIGDKVVLAFSGRMDAQNAPEFEKACKDWIEKGSLHLVIDLTNLAYVSSLGLRSFLIVGQVLKEKNGTLRLCGLTGLVKQVFQMTRLTTVFPIHETVESALAGA
jgi:stage II sporulation protein AA (anti-sigma F factor antagonist)